MKKKKINILNINENLKIKIKLNKYKSYYIGPWCKTNLKPDKFDLKNTLNMYSIKSSRKQAETINFTNKTYNVILNLLHKNLNKIHNKKFSKQFWEILLFRWLYNWINITHFIWIYVNNIKKKYNVKLLISSNNSLTKRIPLDTKQSLNFIKNGNFESWRGLTFKDIFNYQNKNKNQMIFKYIKTKSDSLDNKYHSYISYPKYSIFNRPSKIFYYKLELNLITRLKLRKKYKFNLINFFSEKKIKNKSNNNMRLEFEKLFHNYKNLNFLNFLISQIKYNLPKIFLENFCDLERIYEKSKWPTQPKYILTSYALYLDDLFNYYVAFKKEFNKKTKLLVLQHGYGNDMFIKDDFISAHYDRKISDQFLHWGKSNSKIKKNKSLFYPKIKSSNIKSFKFNKKKNILIMTYNFPRGLISSPYDSLNGNIMNKIVLLKLFKFIDSIKSDFNRKIIIRNLNLNLTNNYEKSIKDRYNFIKITNLEINFLKIVNNFNLFIHTYFGTSFFETMALNKPTLIIFEKKLHPSFNDKFQQYIKKFMEANILFENELLAAIFLKKNYNILEKWWNKKKLQKIREDFCNEYCHISNNQIELFEKILK